MAIGLIPGKLKYLHTYFHPEMGKVRILDYYPEGTHPVDKNAKGPYYKVQQVDPPQNYSYVPEDTLSEEEISKECVIKVWDNKTNNYSALLLEENRVKRFPTVEEANNFLTEKGIGGVVIVLDQTLEGKKTLEEISELENEINKPEEN
jgi:hypothetical protein